VSSPKVDGATFAADQECASISDYQVCPHHPVSDLLLEPPILLCSVSRCPLHIQPVRPSETLTVILTTTSPLHSS